MNSDWKNAAKGHTVKIATQRTFSLFSDLPRGTAEQVNKACDAYFKRKGIVYGETWFSRKVRERKEKES